MTLVDANILLRYLLKDDPELSATARGMIANQSIHLTFEVIAEVVYVMTKSYGLPRMDVSTVLTTLLYFDNVTSTDDELLLFALGLLSQTNMDFVDCILIGYNNVRGHEVLTFDKQMKKYLR